MSSESSPVSCYTRVFWDAVDFPFPKDLAPETIYNRMKLTLEEKMGFMGDLSIIAYVNSENNLLDDKSAYESAGFNIISHQQRHRFMLRDIAWWEVDSTYTYSNCFKEPSQITFVVISSLSEEESIFLKRSSKPPTRHPLLPKSTFPRCLAQLSSWTCPRCLHFMILIILSRDAHARAHRMSVDIVLWALDHPATYFHPRDLWVFSENVKEETDFFNALKALGDRYYSVRVLTPNLGDHQIFSNHMPRISREDDIGFSSGLASLYHQRFNLSQIHVFCDAQSCPTDISIILPVLREKRYHGRLVFRPYLPYQADESLLGYSDDHDGYIRVPSIDDDDDDDDGDSYAVRARMLLDILFWAMNHEDLPQNLIIVSQPSKDIDIVVQALERRDAANQILRVSPCRTITDVSRNLKQCRVIIFWLVDRCPSNPYEFRSKFTSTLEGKGYAGFESVTAYVVEGVNTDEEIEVCRNSGLQVDVTPKDDEYGKFSSMLLDMINWTQHGGAPFNFLVISNPFRDAMCDSVFADVKSRGFNVLFETLDYMVTFGTSLWSAESILHGDDDAYFKTRSNILRQIKMTS
ncbi:unnamed protein product [Eruca vesicaria subsp. sativa]|uniref:NYN domain-containing protein n=1 Tax=Eruca vesicaria subsp. sativa TaxID=29727 RepID=A0ABC8J8D4_ERUVS|nr:unnamed protein product [Eruca vesicaria subsp. sativa]